MELLQDIVRSLPETHQRALQWFVDHTGSIEPWPKPIGEGVFLASRAKGIYKPHWSEYALSIRQMLSSPYADREPRFREDGTWAYAYFQENEDPSQRDSKYTNRSLLACWRDRIPVGVLRQVRSKPDVRYEVTGVAIVAGWEEGYFYLEGFSPQGLSHGRGPGAQLRLLLSLQETFHEDRQLFNPTDIKGGRERAIASIVQRRGQPAFRKLLLEIYCGRCAITDCSAVQALEAAHIMPYQGPDTNHPCNGILLRSDLHVLFDLGLIAVDPSSHRVLVSVELESTEYWGLRGRMLRLPERDSCRPSSDALEMHRRWAAL